MIHSTTTIEKQNWLELASVQVGGAICLPLLLVGYELAKFGNPLSLLFSIFWGNLLLFALAIIAGFMSTKRPLTTVEQAACYLGPYGRIFFALTLAGCMLGWFAIQTQCMGQDVYHLIQKIQVIEIAHAFAWKFFLSIVLGGLMIAGAFWGIQFFTWMSKFCVPLLIGTVGYAVYVVAASSWAEFKNLMSHFPLEIWNGKGVSLVLASSLAGTIDLSTFYRHSDCSKSKIAASILNYLIAMPLIQIAGMCLYYGTHALSISDAMRSQASLSWEIWVVFFMLLAGWTTNNMNLYSAAMSLKSLYKNSSFSTAMGITGLGGILLIFVPVLDQFASVLDLMGIFVAAMGGSMFMAYLMESFGMKLKSSFAWTAWCLGLLFGLGTFMWPDCGSGAPVLDAGLMAMGALLLIYALDALLKVDVQLLDKEKG